MALMNFHGRSGMIQNALRSAQQNRAPQNTARIMSSDASIPGYSGMGVKRQGGGFTRQPGMGPTGGFKSARRYGKKMGGRCG